MERFYTLLTFAFVILCLERRFYAMPFLIQRTETNKNKEEKKTTKWATPQKQRTKVWTFFSGRILYFICVKFSLQTMLDVLFLYNFFICVCGNFIDGYVLVTPNRTLKNGCFKTHTRSCSQTHKTKSHDKSLVARTLFFLVMFCFSRSYS